MSSNALSITTVALMLTACASSPPPSQDERPLPPASLLAPCPELIAPRDDTMGVLLELAIDMAARYHDCAARHRRLAQWAADPDGLTPGP